MNLPRNLQSGAQPSLAEKTRSLSEVLMKKLCNDIASRAGPVVKSLQDIPDPAESKIRLAERVNLFFRDISIIKPFYENELCVLNPFFVKDVKIPEHAVLTHRANVKDWCVASEIVVRFM